MAENENSISNGFKSQVKPLLNGFIDRLLEELEKEKMIHKFATTENGDTYYRIDTNPQNIETVKPSKAVRDIFKQLFELRNTVTSVFQNLKYPESDRMSQYTLSQIISKLEEHGAISAPWIKNPKVASRLDKLDKLIGDEQRDEIEKMVADNNIKINLLILQLLEFYGIEKAKSYFTEINYGVQKQNKYVDLLLSHQAAGYPTLMFEFKYRKASALPSNDILLKALRHIEEQSIQDRGISQYFLVIFTQQDHSLFEKIKLQFDRILRDEIKQYDEYKDRIRFIPIATNYLNLIEDAFNEFKDTHIEQNIHQVFQSQIPPKKYPDRNDHFLERTFEFKKNSFEITITPASTKVWRFGFKFSKSERFPLIAEPRHIENNGTADVHVAVGDLKQDGGNPIWVHPNQLGLNVYYAEIIKTDTISTTTYSGEPVTLIVNPNNDGSLTDFEVKIGKRSLGKCTLNLKDYTFARIHAWCDFNQFQLTTEIKVTHKGSFYN